MNSSFTYPKRYDVIVIGAGHAGTVTSVCQMKMMTALLLAWFFAAKVGAGLAAELGSMRINDELSAMDALGRKPEIIDYVESYLFNSNKCFALFKS